MNLLDLLYGALLVAALFGPVIADELVGRTERDR